MKLFHRYIFKSVFLSSAAAVGLFVFILLAGNALKEIIGLLAAGQLTGKMFADLLVLLIPYVVSYALPLGILTGILMVLGRMSAGREIVALKSAGVSLWRLSASIFAVTLIGIFISLVINNRYAPEAKSRYKDILANLVREDPLRFIVERTFIKDFPGYVLYVDSKEGRELGDLWIWELDDEYRALRVLRAQTGRFDYEEESDTLILTLKNASAELRSENHPDDLQTIRPTASFRETRLRLPLDRLLGAKRQYVSLSALNLAALLDRKNKFATELERLVRIPESNPEEIQKAKKEKIRVQLRIQKNFAMAFSVLSLAMIGIPLGVRVGRKETYANVALALILAMIYYFLIIAVGWLENEPALRPDLLIWLPNLLFQTLGLWLLVKANRR